MNEDSQPFTSHVTKGKQASSKTLLWLLAALVALGITVSLLWFSIKANRQEVDAVRSRLDETRADLTKAHAELQASQDLTAALRSQLANLETEREAVKERAKSLEDEMRADLESKDITISKLQGKLTVNILDRVMFNSGEAVLKPDGEAVMKKIATLLRDHPELKIHVIGHTDNIRIRPDAHSRFLSNWELSTARALAALHFLTDNAGVDPHRVGAVGYGEYRPIADNATAEGRAKNRRIAIMILPDELIEPEASAVTFDRSTNDLSNPSP